MPGLPVHKFRGGRKVACPSGFDRFLANETKGLYSFVREFLTKTWLYDGDTNETQHRMLLDGRLEAGQFQSHIDAIEKVACQSRLRCRGYMPIGFVPNEKLSRHDNLLLVYDAYTLSQALGMMLTLGKIIHRNGSANGDGSTRPLYHHKDRP